MKQRTESTEVNERVVEAEHLIGKVLCRVDKLHPSSGVGFALCFGDKITDANGPMAVVRMEEIGDGRKGVKFYYDGQWKDEEMMVH